MADMATGDLGGREQVVAVEYPPDLCVRRRPNGGVVVDDFAAWELLEAAPDGLVVCDGAGLMMYANTRLEAMTGYERSELLGRPVEMLVPELSQVPHRSLRLGFAGAPRTRMMGEGALLDIRCRDGSTVPVEISLAPAQVAGVVMTAAGVRDVSAQRAADSGRRRLLTLLD